MRAEWVFGALVCTLGVAACAEEVAQAYRRGLEQAWDHDRRRRTTSVGPHRDELSIVLLTDRGAIAARSFGSGGQRRTAALALRLVQAAAVRRATGSQPLLLLDDAFAELDDGRSGRIMELIEGEGTGQVILTAPKDSDVKLGRDLPRWRIAGGVIEA